MREPVKLKCGKMVLTPIGVHEVLTYDLDGPSVATMDDGGCVHEWRHEQLREVPDIPRKRVADLHAAVAKRVEQLAAHGGGTVGTWLHAELSEFAEALRLLLEGGDDGE